MGKKNFTIKDIAKLAGVSAGTVDRIINERGGVSEKSELKVRAVLEQVEFQPNIIARSLSRKKTYNIAILMPSFEKGEYWEAMNIGLEKGLNEYSQFNVFAERFYFDQFNKNSFVEAKEKLLSKEFNAVIMVPMFVQEALSLSASLDEREIPYIYIDSDLKAGNPVSYFGTDSRISGKVGAIVMFIALKEGSKILFIRAAKNEHTSNQSVLREEGFFAEAEKQGRADNIITLHLSQSLNDTHRNLDKIFKEHQIAGAVTFNSKSYLLVDYLKLREINPIWLLGYDAIPKNVEALKEDYIRTLVGQSSTRQGFESIKTIAEHLVMKSEPKRFNYMPIDLLIKDNVDYYLMNQ